MHRVYIVTEIWFILWTMVFSFSFVFLIKLFDCVLVSLFKCKFMLGLRTWFFYPFLKFSPEFCVFEVVSDYFFWPGVHFDFEVICVVVRLPVAADCAGAFQA